MFDRGKLAHAIPTLGVTVGALRVYTYVHIYMRTYIHVVNRGGSFEDPRNFLDPFAPANRGLMDSE